MLIEIVEEYIVEGVAIHDWHALVDKLIEEGHITESELARDFGVDGFQRSIIRKAQKARDGAGRDKYIKTKSGGIVQILFAGLDDVNRTYWERKHHRESVDKRLQILRDQIIQQHGVDPETLPDPFEKDSGRPSA